ncbi:DUF7668 domain-containing protein [Sphingomonas sp. PWP1-2]|uniref:DUF7668 domain-containing protein n=1 Tax=Sphingomonas sp. PWP1-2 TaxID=2804558 RepID=UPI003CF6DF9C
MDARLCGDDDKGGNRPLADIHVAMQVPRERMQELVGMMAKDADEHSVPSELYATFREIADAFAVGDYCLRDHAIRGVREVNPSAAKAIAESVSAYGDSLAPLHRSTWEYAVYRWMGGYWQMLVDLTTEGEEVSDLTLHAKLHDTEPHTLEIESVHVA